MILNVKASGVVDGIVEGMEAFRGYLPILSTIDIMQ